MRPRLCLIPVGLAGAVLLLTGMRALGGEGVTITITNDGVEDIYVTVYDTNTKEPLAEHQRLNGFSSIPISANPDAQGMANISWTAISVDTREKHCGRGSRSGIDSAATVNVHADSSCQ